MVSVVVATYRRDDDLRKALESLAKQTYRNIEIILVDDNGTSEWNSKVLSVVDALKDSFPDISLKYIANAQNQGSARTRNIGIDESNGEFITFLDDDDIYLPNKIKKQVEFMLQGKYDYSITDLILYNVEDKVIDKRVRTYIKDTSVESLRVFHLKYHMTGTDTMMFRKEYLMQIGGFAPIDIGDEFYLMQRAIEGGGMFGYCPGCDVRAYVHTGENAGLSSGDSKIKGENDLFEYKKNYFHMLDPKSVNYIKARHYAVLSFAEFRRRRYSGFVKNALMSFFSSPMACIKVLLER